MEHAYQIDYENVTLRPLIKDDLESLRVWRNNPDNTVYLRKIPIITSEMQTAWFERYLQNSNELCFAIEEKITLARMVGSVSLYDFEIDSCYLGKILIGDPEAHGKKVGLNAIKAALKIAYEQLRMKRVKLHVYADNKVALRIYQNAGFIIIDEHITDDGMREFTMIKEMEDSGMHNMNQVKMLEFLQRGDERGHLVVVEGNQDIPFEIKRVFYIFGSDTDVVRGQHANRESEFVLINVAGKSKVKVKDGEGNEAIYCLNRPHTGIYLPTMVWKDMYDFTPDSVLLVLASTHYDASEYIRDYNEFEKEVKRAVGDK